MVTKSNKIKLFFEFYFYSKSFISFLCKHSIHIVTIPYVQFQFCIDDVRNVQLKMENAVMSLTGNGPLLIYDLYLHFLMDTRNVRQAFKEPPFKSVLNIMKEELNEKINNRIRNSGEYFGKYFETGKRYFAKRNNLKILLSNYLKFVGKIVVLYKRNKKIT